MTYTKKLVLKKLFHNEILEFRRIIVDTASIVDEDGRIPYLEYQGHVNILFKYLSEKTNMNQVLEGLKVSSRFLRASTLEFFHNLQDVEEKDMLSVFLDFLNEKISEMADKPLKIYTFITFLNIKNMSSMDILRQTNNVEKFKHLLHHFGIRRLDSIDLELFDKNEILEKEFGKTIRSNGEIVQTEFKARDLPYAAKIAGNKLEIFLGFIAFIRYYLSRPLKYTGFNYKYDDNIYNLSEIEPKFYLLLENNKFLAEHPYHIKSLRKDIENELNIFDVVDLELEKYYDKYLKFLEYDNELRLGKKEQFINTLERTFVLYNSACSEKSLDYAFLKFWTISEFIIKKMGSRTDDSLINTMEKLLKISIHLPTLKYLKKDMESIRKKRNTLVHSGIQGNISQEDRNLAKLIADCTINFFIHFTVKVENFNELRFVADNITSDIKVLDRYSEILDLLKES